jgi:hypothetical protein
MLAWYAVAGQQDITSETLDLALRVMNNRTLPDRVRIAASVVAGKKYNAGMEFAAVTLKEFVATYGKESVRDMVPPGEWSSPRYAEFQQDLVILFASLLMPRETTEKLILEAIRGRNEQLRRTALMIAVRRWPERVLVMAKNGELGDDTLAVGAALVKFHPSMKSDVEAIVPAENLAEKLREIEGNGIWLGSYAPGFSVFGILDSEIKGK